MQINSARNTNTNFTALQITPASKRYLESLNVEELVTLRRAGRKMRSYKFWDFEIAGFGPVIKNRKNSNRIVDDFRPGQIVNNYKELFAKNPNKEEILKIIAEKKSPLLKALEIVKQLEYQSRGIAGKHKNINQHSSKKELINAMMTDFSIW